MSHLNFDRRIKLDNKVRLSADVLEKAEAIAEEWGLQNAKAAVEAVFRKYADDYMYGRQPQFQSPQFQAVVASMHPAVLQSSIPTQDKPTFPGSTVGFQMSPAIAPQSITPQSIAPQISQAAMELDDLLGL